MTFSVPWLKSNTNRKTQKNFAKWKKRDAKRTIELALENRRRMLNRKTGQLEIIIWIGPGRPQSLKILDQLAFFFILTFSIKPTQAWYKPNIQYACQIYKFKKLDIEIQR